MLRWRWWLRVGGWRPLQTDLAPGPAGLSVLLVLYLLHLLHLFPFLPPPVLVLLDPLVGLVVAVVVGRPFILVVAGALLARVLVGAGG
ncbi:MAG TPA: hypothetical protein VGW74_19360, partial [Propionibacteriaceae bacterium]|nr:hypothetical protein [Propionibacteriaceae bacterium]